MDQGNTTHTYEQVPPAPPKKHPLWALIPKGDYFFTPIILDINIAVFLAMVISGVSPTLPDANSLLKWGANFRPNTMNGEPWRLFTSMFLHFGIIHLAVNMYSLFSLGRVLEKFIGKWRFIALYLTTGLCGSAVSLWWHTDSVSAGASGAIFGLFGVFAAIVTTKLIEPNSRKQLLRGVGTTIMLNALIGLWSGIDNSAHIGGCLGGMLGGYLIFFDLKALYQQRRKTYKGLVIALILLAVSIGFFWMITPKPFVPGKADVDVLANRYDQEMAASIDFLQKMDSTTTLQEFDANVTNRMKHCLTLIDSIRAYQMPEEGEKYFNELRKSTLWGIKGTEYYQRSYKEHRRDLKDSGNVMFAKQISTSDELNKEMQGNGTK
jgi:rhomboid protease GluP